MLNGRACGPRGRQFVEAERNWRASVANYPAAYRSVLDQAKHALAA